MMTDTPMPERQEHAIGLQRESAPRAQSRMGGTVDLLINIAVADARFAAEAHTLEEWTFDKAMRANASGSVAIAAQNVAPLADIQDAIRLLRSAPDRRQILWSVNRSLRKHFNSVIQGPGIAAGRDARDAGCRVLVRQRGDRSGAPRRMSTDCGPNGRGTAVTDNEEG